MGQEALGRGSTTYRAQGRKGPQGADGRPLCEHRERGGQADHGTSVTHKWERPCPTCRAAGAKTPPRAIICHLQSPEGRERRQLLEAPRGVWEGDCGVSRASCLQKSHSRYSPASSTLADYWLSLCHCVRQTGLCTYLNSLWKQYQ